MLEEGTLSKLPRSLLLGTDMAENQKQISQFSQKDAQVWKQALERKMEVKAGEAEQALDNLVHASL